MEIILKEEIFAIMGACFIQAVSELTDEHRAQVHSYLNAPGYRPALLVNLGAHRQLDYERIVH